MFYTVFTFRAKIGQEDAVVALFAKWKHKRLPQVNGFVSSEVLQDITDPRAFMSVVCFQSVEAARAIANQPAQDAWYRELVEVVETEPIFRDFVTAYHIG